MTSINPITPRTETVIVLQGDDDEKLRHLKAEVARIEASKPKKDVLARTLSDADPLQAWEAEKKAAEAAHDKFAAQAEKRGVKVILRAVGRKTWRDLVAKHPPRPANDTDEEVGANADDLQEELVPLCMASPVGSKEEIAAFLDSLSEGQFGALAVKAHGLNMGRTADPTQRLLSGVSRTSSATSS